MYVDTHAHIYHPDETKYPMKPDPYKPPPGTGHIDHLMENMAEAGVGRTVLVQTGSAYRWDNRLLADIADANRGQTVGVCTLDASSSESSALFRSLRDRNVKGLRLETAVHGESLYYHDNAVQLFRTVQDTVGVICAHLHVNLLDQLAILAKSFPEVPIVLDHAAYLGAADQPETERFKAVCAMAQYENIYPKLSFGVTGSDQEYPFTDTHDVIRGVIKAFTPDRCMWGSDFPCELWLKKATYKQHLAVFTEELGLTDYEKTAILNESPSKVWFDN